jgi:hypothetical protein
VHRCWRMLQRLPTPHPPLPPTPHPPLPLETILLQRPDPPASLSPPHQPPRSSCGARPSSRLPTSGWCSWCAGASASPQTTTGAAARGPLAGQRTRWTCCSAAAAAAAEGGSQSCRGGPAAGLLEAPPGQPPAAVLRWLCPLGGGRPSRWPSRWSRGQGGGR